MPLIKVNKPFGLRLGSDRERQDFGVGVHYVTDEEFGHWFVQACIKDGRAALVPEIVPEAVAEDDREAAGPDADAAAGDSGTVEEAAAFGADADAAGDENPEETGEKRAAPTREELMALTVAQLKEMAAMCGVTLASNATKAVIVDAILAGQEGE